MATSYVAVVEVADLADIAACPNPRVTVCIDRPTRCVRLVGEYDDVMDVLTNFLGCTRAEADILISEL